MPSNKQHRILLGPEFLRDSTAMWLQLSLDNHERTLSSINLASPSRFRRHLSSITHPSIPSIPSLTQLVIQYIHKAHEIATNLLNFLEYILKSYLSPSPT